jgi:hypothetical protein
MAKPRFLMVISVHVTIMMWRDTGKDQLVKTALKVGNTQLVPLATKIMVMKAVVFVVRPARVLSHLAKMLYPCPHQLHRPWLTQLKGQSP